MKNSRGARWERSPASVPVLELAGFRSRNDFLVGSNGLLAAFAHQPSPPEYQARREPMATGNIADRHARLHRLGDNGELLIHREPPPAGDAGDHFNLENVSDIGVCPGLSLGPPANAGVRSKQGAL